MSQKSIDAKLSRETKKQKEEEERSRQRGIYFIPLFFTSTTGLHSTCFVILTCPMFFFNDEDSARKYEETRAPRTADMKAETNGSSVVHLPTTIL